jgi:hypothetical protein
MWTAFNWTTTGRNNGFGPHGDNQHSPQNINFPRNVFKGVLRRIYGLKREEDGSWRKLHNDELHRQYSSPNFVRVIKSRRVRWAGHVARMGEGRGVYRLLFGRLEGKRALGRPTRRWKDNIKIDLRETGIDEKNWIQLAQDRIQWRAFVSTVMNLRAP